LRAPLAAEREHVATLFFYGVVLIVVYSLFRIFAPFFGPLGWAAVLAIFVYPWHERLAERYGNSRAAALSTLVVTLLIVGPGLLLLTAFVRESGAALAQLDRDTVAGQVEWAQRMWERVRLLIPGARSADLGTLLHEGTSKAAGFLAARAGALVADLLVFIFQLFVTLLAVFFLLRDAEPIMRRMRRVLPFDDMRRERMIRQTRDMVYASVAAGLVIASLQGLAGGLVFAILGLAAPVFWGVVMGFLAMLPFVGTWVVWVPAAIWLFATGQLAKGVTLTVLGVTIVASIDNFLRPAVLSGRAQMNGLLMFISLLGGVAVFGLLGLVLGPLVVAIASGLLDAYVGPPEIVEPATERPSRRVVP
jgi:predicted PurR-regulated permease PerM